MAWSILLLRFCFAGDSAVVETTRQLMAQGRVDLGKHVPDVSLDRRVPVRVDVEVDRRHG